MRREPRPFALAILLIAAFVTLAMPRPVAACSCVPPDMIFDGLDAEPDTAVFTAVTGPSVGTELALSVTRWFRGGLPGLGLLVVDVVPGDGANCGMDPPPAGREFLFAMPLEGNRGTLHLCSLMADPTTPEGQELLARAMELGPGIVPSSTDPPPLASPTPWPGSVAIVDGVVPLAVAIVFGLGLIGGLVLILRRREERAGD